MISKLDYEFMTNNWEGAKGAAYNQTYEFCRGFGWIQGFDNEGRVIHTRSGAKAVQAYQAEQNYKKIEAI